ncbi:hypothetical protein GCK32_005807 [Trichostrongylus colubriformis]|uniref:Peptidase A2 domain-containing protein n=1 Tax=Trichostrongylus colubriformis TaxID=6319 RepID=A0AAN8FUT5_TRICO
MTSSLPRSGQTGSPQALNARSVTQLAKSSSPSGGDNLPKKTQGHSRHPEKKGEKKHTKSATKVNLVTDDKSSSGAVQELTGFSEGVGLGVHPSSGSTLKKTFFPIGEVSVVDPKARNARKVQVLIDTGAEMSFIETALADKLALPTVEKKQLRYYTFGSE